MESSSKDIDSRFHWADYLIFTLVLLLSSIVGVYYGIKDRRKNKNTVEDFLMAGRKMHVIPVSVSLFISWLSAISFLGDPVEVYYHGVTYWVIGLGYCLACPFLAIFVAPVYHRMKIISVFELFFAGSVLYGPALALAQVSGISVWVTILGVGLVCTFYTTLGGMKAVLWADTLQTCIMFLGLVILLVRGCIVLGGISNVWHLAQQAGRTSVSSFNPNPFLRSTIWTYLIGGFVRVWDPYLSNQVWIQRYCSLRTVREVKLAILLNIPMFALFVSLFCLTGLLLVAYFNNCDPVLSGQITKGDQMLPLMMVEIFRFAPGLSGLFLAGIFSASLSTQSSIQNSLATNILKDFFEPAYIAVKGKPLTERVAMTLVKIFSLLGGLVFIGMAFLILELKDQSIFQISLKLTGSFSGPVAGVFFMALFCPVVDYKGAVIGSSISVILLNWISLGPYFTDVPISKTLPVSTSNCAVANLTSSWNDLSVPYTYDLVTEAAHRGTNSPLDSSFGLGNFYSLSPLLFNVTGMSITILIGLTVSGIQVLIKKLQKVESRESITVGEKEGMMKLESIPEFDDNASNTV